MLIGYLNLTASDLSAGVAEASGALISEGINRFYMDVDTGTGDLPQLEVALAGLGAGDKLVTPSVNTLTRSIAGLLVIHSRLEAIGAALLVLKLAGQLPLDTSTAEGRAILGALAVMNLLPPPVASTIPHAATPHVPLSQATAASAGIVFPAMRPRGRPATAVSHATEVNRLRSEGLRAVEIAACLGIGRASVYRILSQGQTVVDLAAADRETPRQSSPGLRMSAFPGR